MYKLTYKGCCFFTGKIKKSKEEEGRKIEKEERKTEKTKEISSLRIFLIPGVSVYGKPKFFFSFNL